MQIVLSVLSLALLGVATNIATGVLPKGWVRYRWVSWPAAGLFVLFLIFLEMKDKRQAERSSRHHPVAARRIFIDRVHRYWIQGVLERSLYYEARLELKLTATVQSRRHPWDIAAYQADGRTVDFPPDADVRTMFDALDQTVVILGDPGSGKTTMLLELARSLLEEARADESQQVPVVLPLSSWAVQKKPVAQWIADQLVGQYGLPRSLALDWVNDQVIIPLFDGLDEVVEERRNECASAVDEYLRTHNLTPSALCSRQTEYSLLAKRPDYYAALTIQHLTREQVELYVQGAGPGLEGLRSALAADPGLWDLAESPLLLSIMALAYRQGQETADLGHSGDRRQNLYAQYVRTMLRRRSHPRYASEQSERYLAVLARGMISSSQTVFTLDSLNYRFGGRRLYAAETYAKIVASLAAGLVMGAAGYLLLGWIAGIVTSVFSGSFVALSLASDNYDSWSFRSGYRKKDNTTESPSWLNDWYFNWTFGVYENISDEVIVSPFWAIGVLGLIAGVGVTIGVIQSPAVAASYALALCIAMGIALGAAFEAVFEAGVLRNNVGPIRHEVPSPMLRRFFSFAVPVAIVFGVVCGAIAGFAAFWATSRALPRANFGVLVGLLVLTLVVLVVAGTPTIEQAITRWRLRRDGDVPWPYLPFLDFMVQCLMLRSVGSGYIFVHRELTEFMAQSRSDDDSRGKRGTQTAFRS